MRVVLDTNVVIAGLAYPAGPPGRIVAAWRRGGLEVVASPWILLECERALPRLKRYTSLSAADIRDLVDVLAFTVEHVDPDANALAKAAGSRLRDAADRPVLATLIASAADALITGDQDLLALADEFAIVSPAQFCLLHGL